MKIKTLRFGEIDVPQKGIIYFEEGLLGFENIKRYVLLASGSGRSFSLLFSNRA